MVNRNHESVRHQAGYIVLDVSCDGEVTMTSWLQSRPDVSLLRYAKLPSSHMAVPVRSQKCLPTSILKFSVNTSIDDARKSNGQNRHRLLHRIE